jgi:hypothetical protein
MYADAWRWSLPIGNASLAQQIVRLLLEPLGSRWAHVLGVASAAEYVSRALDESDRPVLLAAAYFHGDLRPRDVTDAVVGRGTGARFVNGPPQVVRDPLVTPQAESSGLGGG